MQFKEQRAKITQLVLSLANSYLLVKMFFLLYIGGENIVYFPGEE